jgi:hypothetical protein
MLDSLVRVSRRVAEDHCASILAEARPSVRVGGITHRTITLPERSHISHAFVPPPQPMLAQPQTSAPPMTRAGCLSWAVSGLKRFPFNNFTYFLTLFSKCFSSFDHSTCALSVSRPYLALDEIYHPLRAAFPNNSTRRRHFTKGQAARRARDSHPL